MRSLMPLLSSLTLILIYLKETLLDHLLMIMIVSWYTLPGRSTWKILIGVSRYTHIFAKTQGAFTQSRALLTSEIWLSFEMLSLSWSFSPTMCLLGCHIMSLEINLVPDKVAPDLYQEDSFACLPQGHHCVIDPVILCTESWGDLIRHIYSTAVMCDIDYFSIEYDATFPKFACLFRTPFRGCRVFTWPQEKE